MRIPKYKIKFNWELIQVDETCSSATFECVQVPKTSFSWKWSRPRGDLPWTWVVCTDKQTFVSKSSRHRCTRYGQPLDNLLHWGCLVRLPPIVTGTCLWDVLTVLATLPPSTGQILPASSTRQHNLQHKNYVSYWHILRHLDSAKNYTDILVAYY